MKSNSLKLKHPRAVYHESTTGTNARKQLMRALMGSVRTSEEPKGIETFYFDEEGNCYSEIDLAKMDKDKRPLIKLQCEEKNRKRAIKQHARYIIELKNKENAASIPEYIENSLEIGQREEN